METLTFVAAAVQMCATEDTEANLATCRRLAARAAEAGATLCVLPECFAFLGRRKSDKLALAEALDPARPGPILAAVIDIATRHGMWIVAGGMPEKAPAAAGTPARAYNACVTVSPAGHIAASYRKIHLFDAAIPGRAMVRESDATAPGAQVMSVDTPMARIGLSVCYDLRFPELYRELVVRQGATVVVVPAAFTAHTGAAHWDTLVRARAIENQCYVIAAAQSGRHNDKRESFGHSQIIDPWGTVLAMQESGEGVIVAEIDPGVLARTRQQMPCIEHQTLLR